MRTTRTQPQHNNQRFPWRTTQCETTVSDNMDGPVGGRDAPGSTARLQQLDQVVVERLAQAAARRRVVHAEQQVGPAAGRVEAAAEHRVVGVGGAPRADDQRRVVAADVPLRLAVLALLVEPLHLLGVHERRRRARAALAERVREPVAWQPSNVHTL